MDPSVIPVHIEAIPQALLDRLVKASQAPPPPVRTVRKPHALPSDPHVKPQDRLPPVDSVAIARADGMIAIPK
jgi:hypothetical protein